MQQKTHKTLYSTHSWIGIISGILLFVVTFSGIPALFEAEIAHWQTPNNPVFESDFQDLDKALVVAQSKGFDHTSFFIQPANEIDGNIYFAHFFEDDSPADIIKVDPNTYSVLPPSNSDLAELLAHLHTDLHIPKPWGRYLVGLSGMAMLLAIIAGIFIHLKWRKEFVTLRPKRSWRLLLTDQHKILGLWSLPFTFILAFSGTILGLLGLISPILAVAAFNGDVGKATEAVLGPEAVLTQEFVPSQSINRLSIQQKQDMPDMNASLIFVDGLNDKGGFIKFSGNHTSKLSNIESITYNFASGDTVHSGSFIGKGPFQRIFASVTPLHYVQYGNTWLKVIYALSALAVCGLIITGNMLWLERRRKELGATKKSHWLGQLTLGACGGLVVATALTIAASQVLRGFSFGAQQINIEVYLFWGSWLTGIFLPFIFKDSFKLSHLMIRLTGSLFLLTVIADGAINGRWIWKSQDWVLNIQCGLIACALLCLYLDIKLPKQHQVKNKTHDRDIDQVVSESYT